MDFLSYFALILLVFVVLTLAYGMIAIHDIPYNIAKARNHPHQDAIHYIEHTRKGTVISTAGTVSNRMRGGRPSSVNSISISPDKIEVSTLVWNAGTGGFVSGPVKCYAR